MTTKTIKSYSLKFIDEIQIHQNTLDIFGQISYMST